MIKNGFYHFETVRQSSLASEVEDSLQKHLQEQYFSPNCSNYYIDQIRTAIDNAASKQCANQQGNTITTVSEMVNDLMKRTGLKQYAEKVQAEHNPKLTRNKTAEQNDNNTVESYVDVPEMQQAVKTYIKNNGAFQFAPVLNVLKKIKDELIANQNNPNVTKLSKELISKDLKDDKPLLEFISKEFAQRINHEMSNTVMDLAGGNTTGDASDNNSLTDAAWKQI